MTVDSHPLLMQMSLRKYFLATGRGRRLHYKSISPFLKFCSEKKILSRYIELLSCIVMQLARSREVNKFFMVKSIKSLC